MRSQNFTLRGSRGLWRPVEGEHYFILLGDGHIRQLPWHGTPFDYDAWQFGNCFRKNAEAQQAREKIHELLLIFHQRASITALATPAAQRLPGENVNFCPVKSPLGSR